MFDVDLSKYETVLQKSYVKRLGRVAQVVGLTIESAGPEVNIGATCLIRSGKYATPVIAEVVGFRGNHVLLMPLGNIAGVGPGSIVEAADPLTLKVSDAILGRVLNGLGQPLDGLPPVEGFDFPISNQPPNPLTRDRIAKSMTVGVKAIDGLLTVGRGQRVGIFAGSGVGKSTLLGMIARNTHADISVISLIGERGREVREFIEKDLGEEGLRRSVVVVATSDMPALVRLKAAEVATAIA
ncbi:MAG: hypothetical protein FWB98_02770, partial [Defluviitaleaceae bacterium]|nr:hypothetical protein [Defluviitaleaceae bacterium]